MRDARNWYYGLVCCLSLAILGCGGGADTPPLGTVQGTVTLDGDPLPDATIRFKPESGRESIAVTDANGKYVLQYTNEAPGALVGDHVVIISTATEGHTEEPVGDDEGVWVEGKPETLPEKYHAKSELKVTVTEGSNTHDFPLESN